MNSSLHMDEEITEIYNRQFRTVYRVCFSFMKNAQDAEDMVQETFLKLMSCQRQFETQEHEKAWLIVTASNTCKDELRRWKRRLENIKVFSRQENAAAIEDDSVLEWVMALPVKYKQVIYLYYYEGYRTSEIANMLHCTESTVRNQLLRGRRLLKKSYVFLAAVLAGSLFVATTVYAVYNYGLRDLFLGEETVLDLSEQVEELPTKEVDTISLAGFAESVEYKACSEWNAFLAEYDTDGALRAKIGNGFAGLEEEYELVYGCYTQEMVDKVDAICGKFGLSKLKDFSLAEDYEDLCVRAGIGDVCKNVTGTVRWDMDDGYLYSDGTFYFGGRAAWKGAVLSTADFEFMRTVKGSFNPVTLSIGSMEDYREWTYITQNGQSVLLAKSESKALIVVEREKSFLVVNVLGDLTAGTLDMDDTMLEELADCFEFSAIP